MSENYIYISDLPWTKVSYTDLMPRVDKSSSKKNIELTVNGTKKEYEKGVGAYANCEILYDISNMNIYKLQAVIGIQYNTPNYNTMVNYKIKADGEIIYNKENIRTGFSETIDININKGVKYLVLITEHSGSQSLGCDSVWADAKLFFEEKPLLNANYIYTLASKLDNKKVLSFLGGKLYLTNSSKEINEMFQILYDSQFCDFKIFSLGENLINTNKFKILGLDKNKKLVCDYEENIASFKWNLIDYNNEFFIISNKDNPDLVIEILNYQSDKDKIDVNVGSIKDFFDAFSQNQRFIINPLNLFNKITNDINEENNYTIKSLLENKYLSFDENTSQVYVSDEISKTNWKVKFIGELGSFKIVDICKEILDDRILSYNSNNEIIYYEDFDIKGKFILENLNDNIYIIRSNENINEAISLVDNKLKLTSINYNDNQKFMLIRNN